MNVVKGQNRIKKTEVISTYCHPSPIYQEAGREEKISNISNKPPNTDKILTEIWKKKFYHYYCSGF